MARAWIDGDESAKEMLARVLTDRPFLLLPPLHRVPLRVGNVVEIAGPSPSAKSEILIQAAINCILPKEWNGVHYGGLERLAMYFDLDCRFDVLRLSQSLKHRIVDAHGPSTDSHLELQKTPQEYDDTTALKTCLDEELFRVCMRRFLYIRCYNSFEFLAALKTMRYHLQKESEAHGVGAHFLMIDSINAFYWVDRASRPLPTTGDHRRNLSLQSVIETVVQEIRKLLQVQPMLVLATKANILGTGPLESKLKRTPLKWSTSGLIASSSAAENHFYRDYMPSVWQSFVTHRILLHASDENFVDDKRRSLPIYISQWVLPSLNVVDKFIVRDVIPCILLVSLELRLQLSSSFLLLLLFLFFIFNFHSVCCATGWYHYGYMKLLSSSIISGNFESDAAPSWNRSSRRYAATYSPINGTARQSGKGRCYVLLNKNVNHFLPIYC